MLSYFGVTMRRSAVYGGSWTSFLGTLVRQSDMRQAPKHLLNVIEPIVEGLGYECVGVEFNSPTQRGLLRIYIDAIAGITLEDCSKVSGQISATLDVEEPALNNYELEVSSPGTNRPFFKLSQFERYIGSRVKIQLFAPIAKQSKITGEISGIEGDSLLLQQAGQPVKIAFQAIQKAQLMPASDIKQRGRHGK